MCKFKESIGFLIKTPLIMAEKNNKKKGKVFKIVDHKSKRDFHKVKASKNGSDKMVPIYEVGDFISIDDYKKYKENFKNNNPFKPEIYQDVRGHLFGRGEIMKLISQPECHGIRIYYGLKEEVITEDCDCENKDKDTSKSKKKTKKKEAQERTVLVPQLLLVGVYQDGTNMIDHTLILDASMPCPEYCDPSDDDE